MTAEDKNGQIHKVKRLFQLPRFLKRLATEDPSIIPNFWKYVPRKYIEGPVFRIWSPVSSVCVPCKWIQICHLKMTNVAFRYQWRSSKKQLYLLKHLVFIQVRERLHISLLLSREFKRISLLLCPLKLLDNLWFTDYFRGNRSYFTESNFIFIPCAWRTKRKFLNPHSFQIVNERTSF